MGKLVLSVKCNQLKRKSPFHTKFLHFCSNFFFINNFTTNVMIFLDRDVPTLVRSLRSKYVTYVCCGDNHTAVLTKASCLQIPKYNLEHSKRRFSYTALKAWNDIPMNIKELPTLYQYKKQLKSHLTSWKNNANTTPWKISSSSVWGFFIVII